MKPFSLKKAMANPKKVVTRNGEKRAFAIMMDKTNPNDPYPLIVMFDDDTSYCYRYCANGSFYNDIDMKDYIWDLMMED